MSNRIKGLLDAGQSALSRTNIKGSQRKKVGIVPTQLCDGRGLCREENTINEHRRQCEADMIETYTKL